MKMCLTTLVIKEIQTKTTMRYNFTHTRMAIIKGTVPKVVKDLEQLESLHC